MTTVANTETTQPTRERILNAALICFAERGYAATGMREIARQVGIRAPSLYNHFAGTSHDGTGCRDGQLSPARRPTQHGTG